MNCDRFADVLLLHVQLLRPAIALSSVASAVEPDPARLSTQQGAKVPVAAAQLGIGSREPSVDPRQRVRLTDEGRARA